MYKGTLGRQWEATNLGHNLWEKINLDGQMYFSTEPEITHILDVSDKYFQIMVNILNKCNKLWGKWMEKINNFKIYLESIKVRINLHSINAISNT